MIIREGLFSYFRRGDASLRPLLIALLGALAVVTIQGLLLGYRLVAGVSVEPVYPAPDSLDVAERIELRAVSSEESFDLQARPVFWASRRPQDPMAAEALAEELAAGEPAGELKGLAVTGILANGDQSRVIVTHKGKQMRLELGEEVEGWTLQEVRPDTVVFASATAIEERRLSPMPVVVDTPENKTGASNVTKEEAQSPAEPVERLTLGG